MVDTLNVEHKQCESAGGKRLQSEVDQEPVTIQMRKETKLMIYFYI